MTSKVIIVVPVLILLSTFLSFSQSIVANFILPDTVCLNETVNITNTTTGGTSYYWNFCSGNTNSNPIGINIGNPGNLLNVPVYPTLAKQNNDCFLFLNNQLGNNGLVRYYHGSSFSNNPANWYSYGNFGILSDSVEGMQIINDNGLWYGFICNGFRLLKLEFGTSLWNNNPIATIMGPYDMFIGHCLRIIKEGDTWLGFVTCSIANNLGRFNFGNSLANSPSYSNLGNLSNFVTPGQFNILEENGLWYIILLSSGNNSICRLSFGNSLLNNPSGENLGNVGGLNNALGLTVIRDCESTSAYYCNYIIPGDIGKITFPQGITGTATGQLLGNIGNLNRPNCFSEIIRENDSLLTYITNRQNGTLTRLYFPPCTNATIPSSTLYNPPAFSYNTPGIYNIRLLVNEGLPNQASICKSIVVQAPPCNLSADFTAPDTICVGGTVNIANQTTGGSTYFWSFCSGNTSYDPVGENIGNPGSLLNIPVYMALVKDGDTCYSFITNQGTQSVIRLNHGTSFSNDPINTDNLGSFGILTVHVLGIEVLQENGLWYAFVCNDDNIVRLDFGSSPGNTPTATMLGPYSMLNDPHCIEIFNENNMWIGHLTCSTGNKFVKLNFGNSLLNTPVLIDLGIPGSMNTPGPFKFIYEEGNWFALVINMGNNTYSRLSFGNSLLNTPSGTNIGTVCPSINPGGITLIRDCGSTNGFQLNYTTFSSDLIWRLSLPSGITGPITGTSLGNIGNLNRPAHFSDLFRVGDTLFLYVTNRQNFTLTRLRFLPCTNATVPSSTLYNPPPYSYSQVGIYNVQLIVNEGQANQASLCKNIVVGPPPNVNLGPDHLICPDTTTTLDADTGFSSYLWSTGATSQAIVVSDSGEYWVKVTQYGCEDYDTVNVAFFTVEPITIGPDTTICEGLIYTFDAGNCLGCSYIWSNLTAGQSNIGFGSTYTTGSAGTYMVARTDANGCLNSDTATLSIVPPPIVTTTPLTDTLCSGNTTNIILTANQPGTEFTWTASCTSGNITGFSNGTGDTIQQILINNVTSPGIVTYFITPSLDNCFGQSVPYNVIVNPVPDAYTIPSSQSLCSGDTTSLSILSHTSGSVFSWTATGSSGNVTGYSDGSGDVISQVLLNSGFDVESVLYQIYPEANGCPGTDTTTLVEVFPVADVLFISVIDTVCSGDSIDILLSSNVWGTAFSWSAISGSSFVSGYSNGSGNRIHQSILNTGTTPGTVKYVVTPMVNGCPGTTDSVEITVKPRPGVYFQPENLSICSGTTTSISLFSMVPGASFSWTAFGSSPEVTGYANGAGSIINQTLINQGIREEQVTYVVTPLADGCYGSDSTYIVTVFPVADVIFTPPGQTICSGQNSSITLGSGVNGTTFSWTATGSSQYISGYSAGSGSQIIQNLLSTGTSMESATYNVLPVANNCPGTTNSVVVGVSPLPEVTLSLCHDTITTTSAQPFPLRGGIPLHGTFSGTGITNGVIYPAIAGAGTMTITYTYSNAYGCEAFTAATMTIATPSPHSCSDSVTDIRDGQKYPTVSIGSQCWMAGNLNYGLRTPSIFLQRDNCIPEKFCLEELSSNCSIYGGLYQWDELMAYSENEQVQGLCPPGWHIPTENDWDVLFTYFTNNAFAASPLLYSGYSGYNALLSGTRFINMVWDFEGFATMFWSSTSHGPFKAWAHGMNDYDHGVSFYPSYRLNAFPVRCLKD